MGVATYEDYNVDVNAEAKSARSFMGDDNY